MTTTTPSRTPAILGFLIVGGAILGASFLVSTRADDAFDDVPPLTILAPEPGDTTPNPVTVVFRTTDALRLDPALGWIAGDLHLHAMAGDREIMPAAADIAADDSTFTWRLPPLQPGTHRVYLTWAGRHHGNLRGDADTVVVHVLP